MDMRHQSFKDFADKLDRFVSAWQTLRPSKSFGGMTLEQFKAAIQPSLDARQHIESLEAELIAAQDERDDADKVSQGKLQLVVNGVIGDPTEGPDGDLYEALGYVRKSERKSGLTRGKTDNPATA